MDGFESEAENKATARQGYGQVAERYQSESRESLLAMPSPSNVMEHKEMLIWHKETWRSEKGYKSRPNDRFGFNSGGKVIPLFF